MPEINQLLQTAANAITPSPASFADVQRRFHRRRARRGALVATVMVLTGGGIGVATLTGGHTDTTYAAPQPCVDRTDVNARDTFVAVPRSGVARVRLQVGSTLTVGWLTCGEAGDLQLSDNDPKRLYLAAPGSGFSVPTTGVASARFEAFRSGRLTLTGHGSQGSTGALEITIVPFAEPSGASLPSPYPGEDVNPGLPTFCLTSGAVDDRARVTMLMSVSHATIAPAPGRTSRFTAAEILHRFKTEPGTRGTQGSPQAVFGLFTDNYASPFPKNRPLWVVVVCDAPYLRGSGPGSIGPTPAPGTSPSPGGQIRGLVIVPYDERGRALGMTITGYADAALRSTLLFEVPFERNRRDAMDGRQVGLTYRSDDTCSTFDHLNVVEPPSGTVYVQIWLRLLGDNESCTGTDNVHDVVAGLRVPLGDRPLVRGVVPR